MTLTDAKSIALDQIENHRYGQLAEGAEVAPGKFAPIDDSSRVDWLGGDRYADVIIAGSPGGYVAELVDATGAPVLHTFATAADIRAGALACLARYQQVQGAAMAARSAVRSAQTVEAVTAALAAYLAG